jgi:hypothetical protein
LKRTLIANEKGFTFGNNFWGGIYLKKERKIAKKMCADLFSQKGGSSFF